MQITKVKPSVEVCVVCDIFHWAIGSYVEFASMDGWYFRARLTDKDWLRINEDRLQSHNPQFFIMPYINKDEEHVIPLGDEVWADFDIQTLE